MPEEKTKQSHRVVGGAGAPVGKVRPPARLAQEHRRRLVSGQAWADFCRQIEAAGAQIMEGGVPERTDLDLAEGFRYLVGLVNTGLQRAISFRDPDVPVFVRNPASDAKWGGENADNHYLWAKVHPDKTYRISGQLGNCREILFNVLEGYMQLGDHGVHEEALISDLQVEADGSFEILLSAEPRAGNWLHLHADSHYLLVRQYLLDWETETPATFFIEQVGNEGGSPAPLAPESMSEILDEAALWVEMSVKYWNHWVREAFEGYRPGEIKPPLGYQGGIYAIRYGNDYFKLAHDEAQIIECEVPRARYWHIMLHNNWFQSLDYTNHQSSLNDAQIQADADGKFRVVIAHEDPGVANWLDTCGHLTGMLQYRWGWSEDCPVPTAKIVKFAELSDHLPEAMARVTPVQRREAIRSRQRHMALVRERP